MRGYVYILKSEGSGQLYIGSSRNPSRRLKEHNLGKTKSTRRKGPWKMCFAQTFASVRAARGMELRLKKMKNRKILDRIIRDGRIEMSP